MSPKKKSEDPKIDPEITVQDLLKRIKKECIGCCGQKKDRVESCDYLSCPFHSVRLMAMNV